MSLYTYYKGFQYSFLGHNKQAHVNLQDEIDHVIVILSYQCHTVIVSYIYINLAKNLTHNLT